MNMKIDATDKRILYAMYMYGKSIHYRKLHKIIKELKDYGVKFNVNFPSEGYISSDLDKRIKDLISKGYIKELYYTGSVYTRLYVTIFKLTEKSEKVVKKIDIDKRDVKKIKDFFKEKNIKS